MPDLERLSQLNPAVETDGETKPNEATANARKTLATVGQCGFGRGQREHALRNKPNPPAKLAATLTSA
jgi:hypothetical protein